MSARRRIDPESGRAALAMWIKAQGHVPLTDPTPATAPDDVSQPDRATIATAVRFALEELEARAPGRTLEVRVPPYGAVQVLEGPRHTRGTPPGVVEMSAQTWLELATGARVWDEALASGDVNASGERANLGPWLPLVQPEDLP